jgi:small multidrug resistance pump
MPWIFLSVVILFEVAGTKAVPWLRGGLALVGVFVFYICSGGAVILALRRLELSIAYAIWSGGRHGADRGDRHRLLPRAVDRHQARLNGLVVVGVAALSLAGKVAH